MSCLDNDDSFSSILNVARFFFVLNRGFDSGDSGIEGVSVTSTKQATLNPREY